MNRKKFLSLSILSGTTCFLPATFLNAQQPDPEKPAQLDTKTVQEFVGAGHGRVEKVKTLLEEYPNLINAAHDWGGGDFETALGAASHVGHLELAQYLIDNGAQTNIFTACVFGKLDVVKLMLEIYPTSLHAKGPHGFTLLHHAVKGGENALGVKEYLESLGLKETKIPIY